MERELSGHEPPTRRGYVKSCGAVGGGRPLARRAEGSNSGVSPTQTETDGTGTPTEAKASYSVRTGPMGTGRSSGALSHLTERIHAQLPAVDFDRRRVAGIIDGAIYP